MAPRLLAAAAAAAALLAGCGGGTSDRDLVSRYIDDVNRIDLRVAAPSRDISAAARQLAQPGTKSLGARRKLSRAAARIDSLRRRLAALPAPPQARKLRLLLIELLSEQGSLARELGAYAAFAPAFKAALDPLTPAGLKLKSTLAGKSDPASDARALDDYVGTITSVIARVQTLRPPAVAAPDRASELRTLEHVRSAATALATAVRAKRAADVPALVRRFEVASAGNGSLVAQRARIAAVRSFDRRVRNLATLTAKIERERLHLQASLA